MTKYVKSVPKQFIIIYRYTISYKMVYAEINKFEV